MSSRCLLCRWLTNRRWFSEPKAGPPNYAYLDSRRGLIALSDPHRQLAIRSSNLVKLRS